MAETKEPGQRAYEAWRGPKVEVFGRWETLLASEKASWVRAEQACVAPSDQALSSGVERGASEFIKRNAVTIEEFAGSKSQLVGLVVFLLELAERDTKLGLPVAPVASPAAEAGKAQAGWLPGNGSDLPIDAIAWVYVQPDHHSPYVCSFPVRREKGRWSLGMLSFPERNVTHYMLTAQPMPPPPSAPEGT